MQKLLKINTLFSLIIILAACQNENLITRSVKLAKLKEKQYTSLNEILGKYDMEEVSLDTNARILTCVFDKQVVDYKSFVKDLKAQKLIPRKEYIAQTETDIDKIDTSGLCLDTIIDGVCQDSLDSDISEQELGIEEKDTVVF
jgi:hypothetical protein